MNRKALAVLLCLLLPATSGAAPPSAEPDVVTGVRQVDDGDYEGAILTLDNAARRLAKVPGREQDLAQAYVYLGIAYLAKGHEAAARASFREAVGRIRDLTLSPDLFPPKVIDAFEAARQEARAAAPATAPAARQPTTPAKKGGGSKVILVVGGLAAAGGIALAAGGGGGGSPSSTPTPTSDTRQTLMRSEVVAYQNFFTVTATKPGTLEVTVSWRNRDVKLDIGCQMSAPPYTGCNGVYNRNSDTSAHYIVQVTQQEYLISVSNFGNPVAEAFDITVRYP